MKNLDGRSLTSSENGKRGGRPPSLSFASVIKVLLSGLRRLAANEDVHLEATASLAQRRLLNRARALCTGFDEVIAQSRIEYLKRLEKLGAPQEIQVRGQLRKELEAVSGEVRLALRIIATKAEVLLQEIKESGLFVDQDIVSQLERLSQIQAKSLDQVVELIVGIIQETLDRFGLPLNSGS